MKGTYGKHFGLLVPVLLVTVLAMETLLTACSAGQAGAVQVSGASEELMEQLWEYAAADDWEQALAIDGKDEVQALLDELEEAGADAAVYFEGVGTVFLLHDGTGAITAVGTYDASTAERLGDSRKEATLSLLGGTGVGIYRTTEDSSYYYVGDYVDGRREGEGELSLKISNGYETYSGLWSDDAPNGAGTTTHFGIYYIRETYFTRVMSGTMKDGLWDGEVTCTVTTQKTDESEPLRQYRMSFEAVDGEPAADLTAEYLAAFPGDEPADGLYVYAYTGTYEDLLTGETVTADSAYENWYLYLQQGQKVGTPTYAAQ